MVQDEEEMEMNSNVLSAPDLAQAMGLLFLCVMRTYKQEPGVKLCITPFIKKIWLKCGKALFLSGAM